MFTERFAHWDITIPAENLESLSPGHISKGGWLIQFCFGQDEKGEYLDYYASHRMTDDDHIRLYADGKEVELIPLQSGFITSRDPAEANQLEEQFYETNRRIREELIAKGFTLFTINMGLRAGLADSDKK